jgi:hypothetical protein
MRRTTKRIRVFAAALTAVGGAFLLPTALSVHADTAGVTSLSSTSTTLDMGAVTTLSGDTVQIAPMVVDDSSMGKGRPSNAPPSNPPCDADHGMPLIHSRVCQSPRPGDKEDGNHHCDGDMDADDMRCPLGSPTPSPSGGGTPTPTPSSSGTPTPSSGGGEDVCETGGLLGPETIADQLVDAGIPLNEPEDNGPVSAPLENALSPLDPVAAEVTCAINLLGL